MNNIDREIIIVNDCSTDNTLSIINKYKEKNEELDIKLFSLEYNQGKGAAIHQAIKHACGEFIIIQDADLEYDPNDYNTLLKPVISASADVVYGSRFIGGNPHRVLFYWHSIGNKFLTSLSNLLTNLNLTDMETCYKPVSYTHLTLPTIE